MARVKAPNGVEMEIDDTVASGLVNSQDSEWSYIEETKEPATKRPAKSTKSDG